MLRITKETGAVFCNHKWRIVEGILNDRREIVEGFPVRQIIIWQRTGGYNFNPTYFLPTYEVIYLIAKPGFKLRKKANAKGDVWRIEQSYDTGHPASFPLELPRRCIFLLGIIYIARQKPKKSEEKFNYLWNYT